MRASEQVSEEVRRPESHSTNAHPQPATRLPKRGWVGLGLMLTFWALNWGLSGLRTHLGFFPLWLGYCLTMDALVYMRKGTSLLGRDRRAYVALFLVSAPAWWLFELINLRAGNWTYVGREFFTDLEYFALASLSFSTVMPAVFSTAELVGTAGWMERFRERRPIRPSDGRAKAFLACGWLTLGAVLIWPRCFFPFIWLSLYLILAPINFWQGRPSLAGALEEGDWRPLLALGIGGLICGFFWELWNYHSYPKWTYEIPFVDFLHVFEMPLLGYGGYLPFAMELYALYHLVVGWFDNDDRVDYLQDALRA